MNEKIIETLVRLYAIITVNKDRVKDAVSLLELYLKSSVDKGKINLYISKYHALVEEYHSTAPSLMYKNNLDGNKELDVNYIKSVCAGMGKNDGQELRYTLVIQLLNLVDRNKGFDSIELDIVGIVAGELKVDQEEYANLYKFALGNLSGVERKEWLMIINGDESYKDKRVKHLQRDKQEVEIALIRLPSINTIYFRYGGGRNLYLNGHQLKQDILHTFPEGGVIKTSIITPIYYSTVMSRFIQATDRPVTVFNVQNVEYKFNRKTIALHDFSFQERSGDLVGVIGGSGVGKTTLLNVLNGKLKPSKGKITINGYDINDADNRSVLSGTIGYVPQDDLLIEELTVRNNLKYNAQFCFGELEDAEVDKIVEQTLQDFDLYEARDLVVGNPLKKVLSGGQRKRLNIALELMREPSILFVDEPTSGLSSADSEKVMLLLKKQCLKGRLVFANIHQPSSDIYKLFDRLIMMDKGGRVIFFGNPRESITYFKNQANYTNPDESECLSCGNLKTEQPLRIVEARTVDAMGKTQRKRRVEPEEWYEKYKENVEPRVLNFMQEHPVKKRQLPETPFKKPTWIEQLKLFFKRDVASKKANKQYLLIAFLEAPILACILGFFTRYGDVDNYIFSKNDNIPTFIFMSVIVALFVGLTISVEEIFKDQRIRTREAFLNLSKGAYLTAKIIILFIMSAVQMLSFVIIANFFLEINDLALGTWVMLFSAACFANLLGLNLSSGLDSAVAIYIMVPLILVPQLLLSGVIVDFNKMHHSISSAKHTPIIGDMMASRWAYEGLAVHYYCDNDYEKLLFDAEVEKNKWNFAAFYYVPELRRTIRACENLREDDEKEQRDVLCSIIENSLVELQQYVQLPAVICTQFKENTRTNNLPYNALYTYVDSVQQYLKENYNRANKEVEQIHVNLLASFNDDKQALETFKQKHTNEKLELFVRDKYANKRINIVDETIVQTDEPIYRIAWSEWGRAHFYSAYKFFGEFKIPTLWFNVIVLWMQIILLATALYFDALRKLIVAFQTRKRSREES